MIAIRPERLEDIPAIRAVNEAAFEQKDEADLADALRRDGDVIASLVADEDGDIVGHILFSRLRMSESGDAPRLAALAPMAVLPDLQRKMVGTLLVGGGIGACRDAGIGAIIVLGHPAFYPRFGFSADLAASLDAPFSGKAFMALELEAGALARAKGLLIYADAFGMKP